MTYYQSQQLQDINRNSPRPPIAPYRHVTPLDRQTYTDTTGKHTAQMVSV
nr:hypothetical protein [Enhydrobacter aerosaccus]